MPSIKLIGCDIIPGEMNSLEYYGNGTLLLPIRDIITIKITSSGKGAPREF